MASTPGFGALTTAPPSLLHSNLKETVCYRYLNVLQQQQQQQQQHFISPHDIQEMKFITIAQMMIGALAARNNLRVKNARQPVKRKDV